MTKQRAIICDIDGTIAKHDTAVRSPYQHELALSDIPRIQMVELLRLLSHGANCIAGHDGGDLAILLVSGRREEYRSVTLRWLCRHGVLFDTLYMRANGDKRSDAVVKRELYEAHIEPNYDVLVVFDDRQRVVDMWRKELGLICLQVNYGDF